MSSKRTKVRTFEAFSQPQYMCMYMYIIHYNTGLTDHSSNNHIPLDNEYQALSKPSHAPPPLSPTYYDTMNQNSEWWLDSTLHLVLFIQFILNFVSVAYICIT